MQETMKERIDRYVVELLHIDEVSKNKQMDLEAGDLGKTYYLSSPDARNFSEYMLLTIAQKIGLPGNTALRNSSITGAGEQIIGRNITIFDWQAGDGSSDPQALAKFIESAYKDISTKGNNPLFLGVGELKWTLRSSQTDYKVVRTPILIFPIRLLPSAGNGPAYIEFVNDDVYLNPCLIRKMAATLPADTVKDFPHPNGVGADPDAPIDLARLGDGNEYFDRVANFVASCKRAAGSDTVFDLEKDTVAIAQYNHDEMCMYYDVLRNRDRIDSHPLIRRIFTENDELPPQADLTTAPPAPFTLPRDSVQEEMIRRVLAGESLVIKGPPGTGKTLTIANMISVLMSANKRVLFVSKKLAALSEVFKNIPDRLKKFALLMDYESEAQAAKVNPSSIRAALKELLKFRETYSPRGTLFSDHDVASRAEREARSFLLDYQRMMFGTSDVGGVSLYDAIDIHSKFDLPIIEFVDGRAAMACPRDAYLTLLNRVEEAGDLFTRLTQDGAHMLYKSSWYGVTTQAEVSARADLYDQIAKDLRPLLSEIAAVQEETGCHVTTLDLLTLVYAMSNMLTVEQKKKLSSVGGCEKYVDALIGALTAYQDTEQKDVAERLLPTVPQEIEATCEALAALKCDLTLTPDEMETIVRDGAFVKDINWTSDLLKQLIELLHKVDATRSEQQAFLYDSRAVFRQELTPDEAKTILDAYESLAKYVDQDVERPSAFDFGAKKYVKLLTPLCFAQQNTLKELAKATCDYYAYDAKGKEVEGLLLTISKLLRCELTPERRALVEKITPRCLEAGLTPLTYVERIQGAQDTVLAAYEPLTNKNVPLQEAILAYTITLKRNDIAYALSILDDCLDLFGSEKPTDTIATAEAVVAWLRLDALSGGDDDTRIRLNSFVATLKRQIPDLARRASKLRPLFLATGHLYYGRWGLPTLDDLNLFLGEYGDKGLRDAAVRYAECTSTQGLRTFFSHFESGTHTRGDNTFVDWFEHSFYDSAIRAKVKAMGDKGTWGADVSYRIQKLSEAEANLCELNAERIERTLTEQINPASPMYAFLSHENDKGTLRALFKNYPDAILSMKQCILLSPSSVSVLFRPDAYSHFDVMIIDEASQLEPVTVLPIAFRAKQCVIVGDEWQMPPIRHFRMKDPTVDMDEKEPSLLGLALRNRAFRATTLQCHYRSRTESLIRFSQRRYYPEMRTFPAPTPRTQHLGLQNVFVEGCCVGGINEAEAQAVIERLRAHYDKWYVDGHLTRTVGIVAFGEKQIARIASLARQDQKLREYHHNPDAEGLGYFYRTIEKVQGQQAEDMILSLTYGVNESGKVSQTFGELNRGKLGECIFNVAVTRARSTVTMIHSIRSEDITNENVTFIRDYLATVEQFGSEDSSGFLSAEVNLGLISSIRDYIISLGIAHERVVAEYGVTDGSVRIPIAILNETLDTAVLAIWCEKSLGNAYNYLDFNMRYVGTLATNGWNIHRLYAYDWVNNSQAEKEALKEAVLKVR